MKNVCTSYVYGAHTHIQARVKRHISSAAHVDWSWLHLAEVAYWSDPKEPVETSSWPQIIILVQVTGSCWRKRNDMWNTVM